MSFNPYASDDFNRIQTKSKKSREEQKQDREEAANSIDHPLMEGKKIDMNVNELKTFTKAMEQKEFKSLMGDYVDEISDPKHKPEMKAYLRQMEAQGDLPPGTELIQPRVGFCMKTTCKKMVSERNKTFFDQKCFINVCFHEKIEKAVRTPITREDGSNGFDWRLPYRVSQLQHQQDGQGELVSQYDVVFNDDIIQYMMHAEFQKFVADTAIDGVNQVLQQQQEKISTDYKIMKNMKCKGGEPALMTVKSQDVNPLINNMDVKTAKTKLEKEIMKQKKDMALKEQKEIENQKRIEEASKNFDEGDLDEDSEEKDFEEQPSGIIQPKYKIVHTFPTEMFDAWGGYTTS